jgi:hypothetical protein
MIKKCFLLGMLTLFTLACTKTEIELDDTFETEDGRFINSSRIVYLHGIGDHGVGGGLRWVKKSWQTEISFLPESGIDEYMKNLKEPHIYLDEDAKIHIFKTSQDRDEYINKQVINDSICNLSPSAFATFRFFKDFEVTTEFAQLKKVVKSENIAISNLLSLQTEANDSIAAVIINNPSKTNNIQLTFYKDADFKGTSLAILVPKCDEFYENKRINMAWKWVNNFVNKWFKQKNLNDTASSLKIDFI